MGFFTGKGPYAALLGLSCLAQVGGPARAQDLGAGHFTFRGFATLAATTHDADGIEFRRNVGQGEGVAADDLSFESDSLAGLQLTGKLNTHLDLTLQAVTREGVDGDWAAHVTQAFLRYSPDESLVMRAGRFGYDIYLLAESRQVGYSYLAVRPSQDFYGLVTNDEIDGVDVSWSTRLGPGVFKARLFGGKSADDTAFVDGTTWHGRSDAQGAALDYSFRSLTARLAVLRVVYGPSAELNQIGQALVATGVPQSVALGNDLINSAQESRGLQAGLAYDNGPLQAQVLYGYIDSDSVTSPNVTAMQVQMGYRLRDWTPFVAYARSQNREPIRTTGLPEVPELLPLIAVVQRAQEFMRAEQHSSSLGVRWDLSPKWALKLQADFTTLKDSALNFDRRPPGSGDVNMTVLTAALDMVF